TYVALILFFSQTVSALPDLADGNDVRSNADLKYVFDLTALPQVLIRFSKCEWKRLVDLYDKNYRNEEYVRANFSWKKGSEPPQVINDIGIRVSGNTNRRRPQGQDIHDIRPFNFKLDFNEFVDDDKHEFHSIKGIKFKAAGDDPTMIRGVFALDFLQRFGVWTTPHSSFARVEMEIEQGNGEVITRYLGIYRMVENISKSYLTKRFTKKNNDGDLWKGGMSPQTEKWGRPDFLPFRDPAKAGEEYIDPTNDDKSYQPAYSLKRYKKHDADEAKQQLIAFIDSFDRLSGREFLKWLHRHMDVRLFLKAMAADVALGQTDGYWANTNNFNFYFDEDGFFYFIPMDYDSSLGTTPPALLDDGGRGNWREFTKLGNENVPLIGKLLGFPGLLNEFKGYLLSLANDGLLDAAKNHDIITGYYQLINDHVSNPTGQFGWIADEPAWWSTTPWYRLTDSSEKNNFFRVKQRSIREDLQADSPLDGSHLYVRGLDGWGVKEVFRLQPADEKHFYAITVDLDAGEYRFKVADADWSAATDFGAYPGHASITLDIPYGLAQQDSVPGVQNMTLRITEHGTYSFLLDTLNRTKPYITVQREARACDPKCNKANFKQVFFRGTPNNWGLTAMQLVGDNLWQTKVIFKETDNPPNRFKFDVNGDWIFNFGDTDQRCRDKSVCEGTAITRSDNNGRAVSDIVVNGLGTYNITFNDETRHYRVERVEE
uniref:CotH kinase family protein n=1 Tax=Candidatus Electrothrix sp. TaxID=2170559 RepID=UPI00405697AE